MKRRIRNKIIRKFVRERRYREEYFCDVRGRNREELLRNLGAIEDELWEFHVKKYYG